MPKTAPQTSLPVHPLPINREDWLNKFVEQIAPLVLKRTGQNLFANKFRISCGFPPSGGTRTSRTVLGVCCIQGEGNKKHREVFINPKLDDSIEVGGVVIHEMLHSSFDPGVGHRAPFARAAKAVGLEGKPTATTIGDELRERIAEVVGIIGHYPHESLATGTKKQTTRLLKVICPCCGYVTRTTVKWIDEAGYTICPTCLVSMEDGVAGYEGANPLVAISQHVEYKVAAQRKPGEKLTQDPRWSVFMKRTGGELEWSIIDYGDHVLGVVQPRITPAESREDAIALFEALRDGTMTYDDLQVNDDEFADDDWFDDSPDEYTDDEPEVFDFEDEDVDPRFQWEKDRGIDPASINPETEADKREGWAVREDVPEAV